MEIPSIWLWVSGIAFFLQSAFLVTLTVGVVKAFRLIQGLREDVKPALGKIEAMAERIETIAGKVDGIATKVDGLVSMTQGAVESVGTRAGSIVRSLDSGISQAVGNSKLIAPLMTVLKVVQVAGAIKAAWGGLGFDKSKVRRSKPVERALPKDASDGPSKS